MTEIPDWVDEKISFNPQREVQDNAIVEFFLESDRPYLSSRQVSTEIGMSKQGVDPRLEELEEIGVLDSESAAGGRIYWIRDERSDWPIPEDITVAAGKNDVTIRELLGSVHGIYGVVAVGSTMFSSLIFSAYVFFTSSDVSAPVVGNSGLILAGLLASLFGLGFLIMSAVAAFWNRYQPID